MMDQDEPGAPDTAPEPEAGSPPAAAGTAAGEATGDIHHYIGARLRQAFDDVAKQPVPDRFLQLMAELDRK